MLAQGWLRCRQSATVGWLLFNIQKLNDNENFVIQDMKIVYMQKEQKEQKAQIQSSHFLNRVYAKQISLVYQQLPTLTISNMIGSSVLVFLMWEKVSYHILTTWLLTLFVLGALGSPVIVKIYNTYGLRNPDHKLWGRTLVIYLFIRAAIWGSVGVLFYVPDNMAYQILLLLFVIGGASLVALQSAAYKPVFFTLLLPILAPVIVRFAMDADVLHTAMAFVTLVYGLALIYFYQNIHQTIEESLMLRFEKASLAEKLTLQKQAAEKAYADKTRFIASVSHDLRQPLHAQGLFIAELKQRINNDETKAIVDKLDASLSAMSSLFISLMDLSKLDVNAIQPNIEQFAIAEIFDDIKRDFQTEAQAKNLKLIVLHTTLWGSSDPQLLARILRNLVANAIQYTQKGRILLGCRRRGDKISIQVWDTGIGIPDSQRQVIFEEYRQLNQDKQINTERSGLGLAIVAKLARLLHHEVNVSSRSNHGTVFSIEITRTDHDLSIPMTTPIEVSQGMDSRDVTMQNRVSPENFQLQNKQVLLIEDDEQYRQQTANLLESWGLTVVVARNEKQVVKIMTQTDSLNAARFDLIITDYHLNEEKTGLDLLKYIRSTGQTQAVAIMLTGDNSIQGDMIKEEAYLMYKPVSASKLKVMLETVLYKDPMPIQHAKYSDPVSQTPMPVN